MNDAYNIIEMEGKRFKLARILMERKLGRKLALDEVVHHINGNKKDDSLANLEVMKDYEHISLHQAGLKKPRVKGGAL